MGLAHLPQSFVRDLLLQTRNRLALEGGNPLKEGTDRRLDFLYCSKRKAWGIF